MNRYQTDVMSRVFGYSGNGLRVVHAASELYRTAHNRGLMHKFRSALTGGSYRLLNLEAIQSTCNVRNRHYVGIRTVPINHIRGSEGRCEDFDADFRPLRTHSKERWLRIAIAQQMGEVMPPIKLVQIGDLYFVRDGHHRISVARSLGQKEIEAEVTVWRITGLPPWEPQTLSHALANQSACQVACAPRETSALRVT